MQMLLPQKSAGNFVTGFFNNKIRLPAWISQVPELDIMSLLLFVRSLRNMLSIYPYR